MSGNLSGAEAYRRAVLGPGRWHIFEPTKESFLTWLDEQFARAIMGDPVEWRAASAAYWDGSPTLAHRSTDPGAP